MDTGRYMSNMTAGEHDHQITIFSLFVGGICKLTNKSVDNRR